MVNHRRGLLNRTNRIQTSIDDANRAKIQAEQAAAHRSTLMSYVPRGRYQRRVRHVGASRESMRAACQKITPRPLEQAVNGKFKIARFRLFQMQKNGEEAECCDVVYPNGSTNFVHR